MGRRGRPGRPAQSEFFIGDVEVKAAALDVELNEITGPDQGEGSADGGFGRRVQDHGPVGRSAHAGVRDPDHILDAPAQELLRDR